MGVTVVWPMSTELEYDDLHGETSHWMMTSMLGGGGY